MFAPGSRILYRTIDENQQLTSVLPVRVVEDSESHVCLWLPIGTASIKPVLHDPTARPRRWLPGTWSLQPSTWSWAELLIMIQPDSPYAVWLRWSADRVFQGWYVNMQGPLKRHRLGFDHWDQQLDILVEPDRSWRLKDEDELKVVVELGRMSADQAAQVRSGAERATREIESCAGPFAAEWPRWIPPADWTHPDLPDDWGELLK